MKERNLRLEAIKRIIKDSRIESQEKLLQHLQNEGFNVTQATLSRDLKILKVGKISDGWNGYHYTLPGANQLKESEINYIEDFLRGFLSIEFSGNLSVIKTLVGHANSVALALDKLGLKEILGTVAGDDTILVVLKNGINKENFLQDIKNKIPEIGV